MRIQFSRKISRQEGLLLQANDAEIDMECEFYQKLHDECRKSRKTGSAYSKTSENERLLNYCKEALGELSLMKAKSTLDRQKIAALRNGILPVYK